MQKVFARQIGIVDITLQFHFATMHLAPLHLTTANTATLQTALRQFGMHNLAQVAHLNSCLNVMGGNIAKEPVDAYIGRDGRFDIHQQFYQFILGVRVILARQPAVMEFCACNQRTGVDL